MSNFFKYFLIFLLFLFACGKETSNKQALNALSEGDISSSAQNQKSSSNQPLWVPDQLLVQFKASPWNTISSERDISTSELQFT